ncbi:hypothetical protein OCK74_11360 [Chitinophagaceae bacterium LB-8]|uniref:Uncharacterized protein n=1 Tax=Paraflavisolibacter caeni TaxID=2982496 RepID=A0A9X2XV67_9BACT|nr:hypothetical protein [Paraflavisolibacter caeni]MCU7549716.1 hypothetical protein [Paraflavisolibacter caeni]
MHATIKSRFNIGFNPLKDMLLTIVAMSLLIYILGKIKTGQPDILHQAYLFFDSSDIKGKVDSIRFQFNVEAVKLDNSKQEYLFAPDITQEGAFFHAYTEKGDSFIKPPYSKIVVVKGARKTYTYTFKKF